MSQSHWTTYRYNLGKNSSYYISTTYNFRGESLLQGHVYEIKTRNINFREDIIALYSMTFRCIKISLLVLTSISDKHYSVKTSSNQPFRLERSRTPSIHNNLSENIINPALLDCALWWYKDRQTRPLSRGFGTKCPQLGLPSCLYGRIPIVPEVTMC